MKNAEDLVSLHCSLLSENKKSPGYRRSAVMPLLLASRRLICLIYYNLRNFKLARVCC